MTGPLMAQDLYNPQPPSPPPPVEPSQPERGQEQEQDRPSHDDDRRQGPDEHAWDSPVDEIIHGLSIPNA